jgi:hypothetical protein
MRLHAWRQLQSGSPPSPPPPLPERLQGEMSRMITQYPLEHMRMLPYLKCVPGQLRTSCPAAPPQAATMSHMHAAAPGT